MFKARGLAQLSISPFTKSLQGVHVTLFAALLYYILVATGKLGVMCLQTRFIPSLTKC